MVKIEVRFETGLSTEKGFVETRRLRWPEVNRARESAREEVADAVAKSLEKQPYIALFVERLFAKAIVSWPGKDAGVPLEKFLYEQAYALDVDNLGREILLENHLTDEEQKNSLPSVGTAAPVQN